MDLGLIGSGDSKWISFKPSVNAWLVNGEEHTLKQCLIDPDTLKTGWIKIEAGSAPDAVWDESIGKVGSRPSDDHKRGLQVMLYLGKDLGWHQWQTSSVGALRGFSNIWSKIHKELDDNEGKVAHVEYLKSDIDTKGKGQTRIPVFALLGWKNPPQDETEPEPKVEIQTTEDLSKNLF